MILIKPFVTEKSSQGEKNNCYTLSVNVNYNKIQIKKEIKKKFGFSVKNVRTMIYPRKDKSKYTKKGFLYGKTKKMKKVIIQFKENQKIDFFNQQEV
ncbi:50S ribosomal protein L23 [Blattabacterium sp. (Blattella germanica) str. Bge]|uniref:50S ribosomal protein L23 n=1 Tax=Blattabacterium sp. (Blattella germanica) TaxID=624186 RepID=UPI0001BB613A|nr:50S ribosomal protein L23 [Blattabacterium sp. (Blattella germanica)]ACY40260.1 50S ribosomal protein L23 [Blattabacterium sp. (Blattella germanica) str. Bge]